LLDETIAKFLLGTGLATSTSEICLTPLTGGVASDIWKVETSSRTFVVKKALSRLRVAQEWNVPVSRNASEADWMIVAASSMPNAVPQILARDTDAGIFAMSYLDPAEYPVWKQELQAGRVDLDFAAHVGRTIAAIHAATAGSDDIAQRFANDRMFHSIRIEPYFEATARCHPDLMDPLMRLAHDTLHSRRALVHGDVSPKNILSGPHGPVFLDAECAWYGEPAFDLAFCLSHLLLKCIWVRSAQKALLASFDALATNYLAGVTWEPGEDMEARAARILPALLLARVDGKSPVEYVESDSDKNFVRRVTRPLIASPPPRLAAVREIWAREIAA
jgi:5-methylthioribose kinase